MRDIVGSRPFEVTKVGNGYTIKFFPMTKNAKNPNAVIFSLTITKDELKKIEKQMR